MYLLTVEYLFLFSFPGYFPQATFVLLSVLATAPAVWFVSCSGVLLVLFSCSCSIVPFCFKSLFPHLSARFKFTFYSISDDKYTISERVGCCTLKIRADEKKDVFLRGFSLKDASKAVRRGLSLTLLSSEATNMCILYVSKHFTIKGKVLEKCCWVGLCCFNWNSTIYCFSCRIIRYQILLVFVYELE